MLLTMSRVVEEWMRVEYAAVSGEMRWVALLPDRSGGHCIDAEDALAVLAERGPNYHHWLWGSK
jgi:hypothetical protein